jgi:sulfatase maturation enzyme AslB (radical SAM superfamily)
MATNGLLAEKIYTDFEKILKKVSPKIIIIVNLSIDGTETVHDKTRGGKDFFKKLILTHQKLKSLKKAHQNLKIAFHTGVSTFNKNGIPELLKFLKKINPDSYILEPCIDRTELLKEGVKIQISLGELRKIIKKNKVKIWQLNKNVNLFIRLARMGYYPFVFDILEKNRQVIACQAGQTSLFLDPYGNLSSCELKKPFVNLTNFNYNLKKAFFSKAAKEEREKIKDNQCFCPTSNCYYSSIEKAPYYLLKSLSKLALL